MAASAVHAPNIRGSVRIAWCVPASTTWPCQPFAQPSPFVMYCSEEWSAYEARKIII
jgi:hypothetical protein